MFRHILFSCVVLAITACTPGEVTRPGDIRWDREVCARCSMAIGDRSFAAQVRGAAAGDRTGLYKFDDIGCAVIWLEQQAWRNDPRTEVWVVDHRNGEWLDARKATYVKGRISPMNYGLAAQAEAVAEGLDFEQAKTLIMAAETQRHSHDGHTPVELE